ncbi:MAG: tetratricopeptide repeat protein [Gemmatimonadales bacterium]
MSRASLLLLAALPVSLAAQNPEYRSPSGVTYGSERDTGAVARLQAALATDSGNPDAYIRLGGAQAAIRQYREAIVTYTRGLAKWPDNALLYRYRGHRYISVREFDRALADLTRGNRLDTTNYDIWYHLGVVRFVRGDFAGASDAFTHAQRMAPNPNELAGSTDWLWMSASRAGRTAEAARALLPITDSLGVTTARAYFQRLKLYRGRVAPNEVVTPADTDAIQVATLSFGIGNWYLVQGDSARAREWFERSVASGGWPAFGFICSEVELGRMRR